MRAVIDSFLDGAAIGPTIMFPGEPDSHEHSAAHASPASDASPPEPTEPGTPNATPETGPGGEEPRQAFGPAAVDYYDPPPLPPPAIVRQLSSSREYSGHIPVIRLVGTPPPAAALTVPAWAAIDYGSVTVAAFGDPAVASVGAVAMELLEQRRRGQRCPAVVCLDAQRASQRGRRL